MAILRLVLWLVAVTLLVVLAAGADLGAVWRSLSEISLEATIAALLLVQAQIILSALRWKFTAGRLGCTLPAWTAIREYYVASFLNQTLPGGVGGDVVRAWRVRDTGKTPWKQSAKAILFERFSGQVALFFLAFTGTAFWSGAIVQNGNVTAFIATVMGIALLVGAILFFCKSKKAASLAGELQEVFIYRKAWLLQIGMSFAVLASYVGVFFISAQATGSGLHWKAAITVIPLCLIAMLVPTGMGGWGTREAAAMALWPLIGASANDGLAASITYGLLSLAGALPGIIFLMFLPSGSANKDCPPQRNKAEG